MNPTTNIAVRAARQAGSVIMRSFGRLDTLTVAEKQANDFVTEVDRNAEQAIIEIIRRAYPGHAILAEESGGQGNDPFEWVIDPLDGTTNYVHGFPQFAVSIALRHRGRLESAVIYDPVRDEMFTADRGSGALLNDRRLRVTDAVERLPDIVAVDAAHDHCLTAVRFGPCVIGSVDLDHVVEAVVCETAGAKE